MPAASSGTSTPRATGLANNATATFTLVAPEL